MRPADTYTGSAARGGCPRKLTARLRIPSGTRTVQGVVQISSNPTACVVWPSLFKVAECDQR
jgi:hypothetical protein